MKNSLSKLLCVILVALLGVSCRAPQNNTVVAKAESPNGNLRAVLVDRYIRVALSSDAFFLIVEEKQASTIQYSITDPDIGDRAALIATNADRVSLQWQGNDALLVICDACGLEQIDIVKKLDHIGNIRLIYRGFPRGTANDLSEADLKALVDRDLSTTKR